MSAWDFVRVWLWPNQLRPPPAGGAPGAPQSASPGASQSEAYKKLCHTHLDRWERPSESTMARLWDSHLFLFAPIYLVFTPAIYLAEAPHRFNRRVVHALDYCDDTDLAAKSIEYNPDTFRKVRRDHPAYETLGDLYVKSVPCSRRDADWNAMEAIASTASPTVAEKIRKRIAYDRRRSGRTLQGIGGCLFD